MKIEDQLQTYGCYKKRFGFRTCCFLSVDPYKWPEFSRAFQQTCCALHFRWFTFRSWKQQLHKYYSRLPSEFLAVWGIILQSSKWKILRWPTHRWFHRWLSQTTSNLFFFFLIYCLFITSLLLTAEFASLPLIPAYLDPHDNEFLYGANFASGGSGVLVETNAGLVCVPFLIRHWMF